MKTEAEIHDIHLLPPNEDPETCASWLRMRNRDGRYTLMFEEWVTEGNFIISPRCSMELSAEWIALSSHTIMLHPALVQPCNMTSCPMILLSCLRW